MLDGLGNLTVIATSSNSVAATVTLPGNDISPFGLALSPDGTRAYVTRFAANTIAVIDTSSNNVIAMVSLGALAVVPLLSGCRVCETHSAAVNIRKEFEKWKPRRSPR